MLKNPPRTFDPAPRQRQNRVKDSYPVPELPKGKTVKDAIKDFLNGAPCTFKNYVLKDTRVGNDVNLTKSSSSPAKFYAPGTNVISYIVSEENFGATPLAA